MKNLILILILIGWKILICTGQSTIWDFNPSPDSFSSEALLDLRELNEQYAGENGFIELSDDGSYFVTSGNKKPIRFWAVNGATTANKMTDEELTYFARFLAKIGVNMIRYHGSLHPKTSFSDLSQADQAEIYNIQRVVAAMKKEGIYTTVSIFYTHMVDEIFTSWNIPGYPDGDKKLSGVIFFHDSLKEALKNWIYQLLNAPNPFTGVKLKDEPALAIIQIHNEDGVFFYTISNVSNGFYEIIKQKFCQWLINKYGSAQNAISAWNNLTISGDAPDEGKMALYNIYDATLELTGNKAKRMYDQVNFLYDVQENFYRDINNYLKSAGCRQLINGSNWKTASAVRLLDAERATADVTDIMAVNRYYSPYHTGTNSSWRIDPGHYYAGKSALLNPEKLPVNIKQPSGHPFLVTESGWNLPHKYQAEGPFLVSVFTSLTGIDAFYWFNASSYTYDPNPYFYWTNLPGGQHPLSRWTISIPGQMAMFPAGAVSFRKGYIEEEDTALIEFRTKESILNRNIPQISEDLSFDPNRDEYIPSTGETPFSPLTYLAGKVIVNYSALKDSSWHSPLLDGSIDYVHKKVKNLSRTVEWDYKKGLCTVNTPYFQGLCGFPEPDYEYTFSDVTIRSKNTYVAVSIVSLDGKPLATSGKILVQTGTVYRPTGWTETPATFDNRGVMTEGFLIQNTGTMPWQAEKTNVTIKIKNNVIMRAVRLTETGYCDKNILIINSPGGKIIVLPPNALYTILDDNITGINDIIPQKNDGFIIYPNPASGKVQIMIQNRDLMNGRLEIFDTSGRKVYEQKINNTDLIEIDSEKFRAGIYSALIRYSPLVYSSNKFVIK